MADQPHRSFPVSPVLVALLGWLIPGAGYLLIKQRARGFTIGITILVLFFGGLLVGGVRALDVPGYNAHGVKLYSYVVSGRDQDDHLVRQERIGERPDDSRGNVSEVGWALTHHPLDEVRGKPWSIPQIMMGPIDVLCDWWAVAVSQPANAAISTAPIGARSHSRVSELGVLYTAIAGLLNLLAIIDSSHRAVQMEAQ